MLNGKNILLRPYEAHEWQIMQKWFYESEYREFFRDVSLALGQSGLQTYASMANGYTFLVRNKSDQVVGCVVVYDINWGPATGKIGVLIDKDYQGYRYSMEAICLLGEYCVERLRLRKIICEVVKGNEKLGNIVKVGGFEKEATLIKEAYIDGEYYDVDRYFIFAEKAKENIKLYQKEMR